MVAARETSAAFVQLLLNRGADIAVTDKNGHNALFAAAGRGHVHVMEVLLKHGHSVTMIDCEGATVLMAAVLDRHESAAEWLLQHGVAVNAANDEDYTALHYACMSSSCEDAAMVELLLASGADVHMRTRYKQTALDVAVSNDYLECAKVLIAAGTDVNNSDSYGITSLHIAINKYHSELVQLLLEHGATAVMNDVIPVRCAERFGHCCRGMTALMACTTVDTAKVLLAAGADVHVTNDAGNTCLHLAAKHELPVPVL
jgi:uncharacterized protein